MKHKLLFSIFILFSNNCFSNFWNKYYDKVNLAIEENFWGSLATYKYMKFLKDPYISQLEKMGYIFENGKEKPAKFQNSIKWVNSSLNKMIESGIVKKDQVFWPAKAFRNPQNNQIIFIKLGDYVPENYVSLNLLTPDVFVKMLSQGYFPIGDAIREHTNQTLAEHDIAHMAGFISSPKYMIAIKKAFERVGEKMKNDPKIKKALLDFDSVYSLRLYYMIEIFTKIPKSKHAELEKLIELPLNTKPTKENVSNFLKNKAKNPAEFYQYLSRIYEAFPRLVNPVGGESRDLLNRTRKFKRGQTCAGAIYSNSSKPSSKFNASSIYSLYLNGLAILEHKRSNHPDFLDSIEVHTPFIGSLIGTSQIAEEDWVLESVENFEKNSKLSKYICDSGFWDKTHVIYWAYCEPNYDLVIDQKNMQ